MSKVKGEYWRIDKNTVRMQIKTDKDQRLLEEVLPGWECISYGYVPRTSEEIYVFEKVFESESVWNRFIYSEKVKNFINMKEVLND